MFQKKTKTLGPQAAVQEYLNNASKRPPLGASSFCTRENIARGAYCVAGAFLENDLVFFGRHENNTKSHAPHTLSNNHGAARGVDHVANPASSRRHPSPTRAKTKQTLGDAYAVPAKRRPRGRACWRPVPHLYFSKTAHLETRLVMSSAGYRYVCVAVAQHLHLPMSKHLPM